MSYSGRFQNSILTKQDQILKSNLIKDWRNGMYHNIPISATFNVFKYLNLTASFNFTDRMYTNKVMREWDTQQSKIVQDTTAIRHLYFFIPSFIAHDRFPFEWINLPH